VALVTGRRLLTAVIGAVLAAPAAAVPPAAPAAVLPAAAHARAIRPATPTAAKAPVPCPTPAPLPTPPNRPPAPSPPAGDPVLRSVGGLSLATSGLTVPPGAPRPPAVSATSWLVADLDSGAVLGGCGPHEYGTPASVQKLLLAATLLPKLDPRQVVTVTRADMDFESGSSSVGLLVNGRYSVETLWLGLLLNSGNDAANVLARVGGGSAGVAGTVRAMNEEAQRLGSFQTHAVTPSGLDAPGQFTSAYDLALIARACFADARFRRYAATERAQIPAQPPMDKRGFQIQNENQLLLRYPGALGGKTGFTNLARHTYVGAAERNGRRLVVTLLGAEARPLRGWQQGAALLDWGFTLPGDLSVGRLVAPGEATPFPASTPTGVPGIGGAPAGRSPAAPAEGLAGVGVTRAWPVIAVGLVLAATLLLPIMAARRRRRRLAARRRARAPHGRRPGERQAGARLP
jgi:serine-type D-Ala-D-Ala carboxypeptidase (penicillin-binding protein 5/6)